jgi:hypothetical protein
VRLLKQVETIDKELGLGDLHDRDHEGKIEYVATQINEIKQIMWRLRCDILLNSVIEVVGDAEEAEQENKVKAYKRDLKRMGQAIDVYEELLAELKDKVLS